MTSATPHETILKVMEGGLETRNLRNFISDGSVDEVRSLKKPPISPRPQSVSPKPGTLDSSKGADARLLLRGSKRRGALSRPKSRLRSASAGRNPEKDLRVRYWTFLFENLHRAVDEIYQTCEMDESIVESKEAIMMLENYSKDFHSLIQYININKTYEKTAPPNRPTSLAWEVRKSSPGKSLLKNVFIEKLTAGNNNVKRILCFDAPSEFTPTSEVKNLPPLPGPEQHSQKEANVKENDSKSKMNLLHDGNSNNQLPKPQCDVTVSVVSEIPDESFPCNKNLVVNQVHCQNNNASSSEPNVKIENENESLCSASVKEQSLQNYASNSMIEMVCDESLPNDNRDKIDEIASFGSQPISKSVELSLPHDDGFCQETGLSSPSLQSDSPILQISNNDVKSLVQPVSQTSISSDSVSKELNSNERNHELGACVTNETSPILTEKKVNSKPKPAFNKNFKRASTAPSVAKTARTVPTDGKFSPKPNGVPLDPNIKILGVKDSKENRNVATTKNVQNNKPTLPKSMASTLKLGITENGQSLQKSPSCVPPTKPLASKPFLVRKVSGSSTTPTTDEKKNIKTSNGESAIKRNISYVQSLSSKNHSVKSDTSVKKAPSRGLASSNKLSQKSGSLTSLHKTPNSRNWAHKTSSVEKIPEILKSNTDDDSDGWETVRGRNRCRNSPAKKISFMNKNQESQAIQLAKLNQSRIGGFPYTTKVNGRVVSKNSPKSNELPKKNSNQSGKSEKGTNSTSTKVELVLANTPSNMPKTSNGSILNSLDGHSVSEECLDIKEHRNKEDFYQLRYKKSTERISRKESLRLPLDVISALEENKDLKRKPLVRSSSAPSVRSTHETNLFSLSKALCISDQSLGTQKYININLFKKKLSEKGINSTKRRVKKAKVLDNQSVERSMINGSLDESDNGLTSDDQDGPLSHDEAFDVQCQELYDTAWKYKILEQQVHKLELSWGEQMDRFDMELRTPGRALEMHEKLSSPFRKKSLFESIRVCNEKQLKAQEQRERLLEEKAQKFKIIQKKRHEMKSLIEQRQEKQRSLMEQKLQRAEEKRKKQLQMIIRKAHDEEEKVNEIAFINSLEAQNKRHDLISKEKDHEARLQDIQEERQRRQEEKAAKEAAAEGRRKILEAERQARLNEMQEKRKMRDHKVEQLFLVKEKERQELASQKARDRELRISALNAQQQITIEELQKKIQLKQEESARRHEENMELIRQKAFELSIRRCSSNTDDVPQPVPYETKKICTICNVLIGSEVYLLSHLHGKKHQEAVKSQYQDQDPSAEELELYNLKHIVDASTDQLDPNIALDKERQKALKKRCKKIRQRMSNRGQEYESHLTKAAESLNSSMKVKMDKIISDIKKLSTTIEECANDSNVFPALERHLNEIFSIYQKKLHQDKIAFKTIGGVTALINIYSIISHLPFENNVFMYKKILNHLSNITESVIENSYEVCKFILFSNKIGNLLDFLIHRLNDLIPDNISQLMINQVKSNGINIPLDLTAGKLMHLLTGILTTLSSKLNPSNVDKRNEKDGLTEDFHLRIQDVISYIVSIGIVDKLSQFFNCIQGLICNEAEVAVFLLDCIAFLTDLIKLNSDCSYSTSNRKIEDSTQLIATFRVTNMVGAVSLLYGLLLHSGASSRSEGPPPVLPKQIEVLAFSTLCMLNHMAVMSLQAFQSILGSEGLSLQLRHITSHLLWYCNHLTSDTLLHEIILLVGYFTALNPENQSIIQAGQRPTVLQQLCCLPFLYFSDLELTDVLFPTLIACCYNNPANKTILQQEMTSELLSNYIEVKYLNIEDSSLKENNIAHNKRWLFSVRFPKCHWSSAKHYFSAT